MNLELIRFFGAASGTINLPIDPNIPFRVHAIHAQVTSSADVANRNPRLIFRGAEGGSAIGWVPTDYTQAASLTFYWNWFLGVAQVNDGGVTRMMALPDINMPARATVQMVWAGWQAADVLDAGWMLIEYLN